MGISFLSKNLHNCKILLRISGSSAGSGSGGEFMYMSAASLMREIDASKPTIERRIREMKLSGVYPPGCFLTHPRRIDKSAFLHFCCYKEEIDKGLPFPKWEGKNE